MRFRRIAAALGVAAVAGGGALAISTAGSAATPAPTPISLGLTGMASSACPLPLNGSMAVKPGTTVQFKPDTVLGHLTTLSLSYVRETSTTPKPAATSKDVPNAGLNVAFSSAGTYDLSWHTVTLNLLGVPVSVGVTTTGKLLVNSDAAKCVIAVQVPTPSVSVSGVPDPVTSTVNGIVGGVVSGVNGVLNPVNGVVGPILGGGPSGLPIPGGGSGGSSGGGSLPSPVPGTNYHPTGPTVAQRTVPQGYGNGSGVGGTYVPAGSNGSGGGSASGTGSAASGNSGPTSQPVKSGGSPKTVELAANKPRSALDGWSALIVLGAVLALSGATAFYARSYLLQPAPAKLKP